SYSIGTVALDPADPATVWVGTGENNSQRSVGYGDGIYKSLDGGRTFTNMGLGESEHIARIHVDPRDSDRVLVAAQGPLWRAGGDRGVYLTTDGGESWTRTLEVDEHTGATDLVVDPRDPDVLYAATYQRARRVWTLIDGGPGSGIWKSTDGGETWRIIESGIPAGDKGRIGLAIAPTQPDRVYALVELPGGEGGFYVSENRGESWTRRSSDAPGTGQYYSEIQVDLQDPDVVYLMDTFLQVTRDGGRTFQRWGEANKHVDNHAMWQDPDDLEHFLVGCDGGLYETFDGGETFRFFPNLPLGQYYKVAVGPDAPFYRVYGGTQDNASHGVPVRTMDFGAIQQSDWFVLTFGDGFGPAVDPANPDIIYAQSQNGGLVRYDHRSGEAVGIAPRESPDGPPLVFNWDSPIVVSPHDPARLYYGAQILFRSDDRGDSWRAVSGDLTRGLDR
ncbi:MAG: glycosyl hydrolase, partial [Gemmatimonadota bacterium]